MTEKSKGGDRPTSVDDAEHKMKVDCKLIIDRALQIMTTEQVGRWEGVRTFQERYLIDENEIKP